MAYVDDGTLGAAQRHDERTVVRWELLYADVARNLAHAAEHAQNAAFQRLLGGAAREELQLAFLELEDEPLALGVAFVHLHGRGEETEHVEKRAL